MCTAITYKTDSFYFGRTLDLEYHYKESIAVTPRGFFEGLRYAIIGVATVENDYPLYYDAVNEKGLCMAALAFWNSAKYNTERTEKDNVASFELIPYILSKCSSVKEARELLSSINITNKAFSEELPPSPLHWMISDRDSSIIVEPLENGLKVYDNPVGVLTNNPTFDMQLFNLNNYRNLSVKTPENTFAKDLDLDTYSRGMGAIGLPGDLSSASRFVKVAFTKENSFSGDSEAESVSQFFHILGSVEQQKGLTFIDDPDLYEYTIYSSCYNTDEGILYYKTYDNSEVWCVDMYRENMDGSALNSYGLKRRLEFKRHN